MNSLATLPAAQAQTLEALRDALSLARAGAGGPVLMPALAKAESLLPSLPPAFAQVLQGIAQRLESSALFADESCSFSHADLFEALQTWVDKAHQRLHEAAAQGSSRP